MSRRQLRWLKRINLAIGSGIVFGSLTCVSTAASGINTVGSVGVSAAQQTISLLNGGAKIIIDLVRALPVVP